jgi:sulfur-oxidizing protein SoxY
MCPRVRDGIDGLGLDPRRETWLVRANIREDRSTMTDKLRIEVLARRDFLIGAAAAAVIAQAFSAPALAQDKPPTWEEAMKKIVGDAKPVEGKINLDMPEIAENGNTVPFNVIVDSPMTDAAHVKSVTVFSTGNPQPVIASYRFTPTSGKAAISSRMRLAKTQDIVALAELSDGKFIMGKRTVKVTIGGCGG